MDRRRTLSRGRSTWVIYAVFASMAYLLNGMGAVLAPLQRELHVSRGEVAVYPSLFAVGLIVVGLAGATLVNRIGRGATLRVAMTGILAGGLLIAAQSRIATLLGALLLGLGAALLVQLVPAVLSTFQPQAPTAAIGEANGLASATSVLAPLSVSAALLANLGWRTGYLAPPLTALALIALPAWRLPLRNAPKPTPGDRPATAAPVLGRWIDLVLAVSVEFCMIFWAASAFIAWDRASLSQAPALASLFLVGMAIARGMSAAFIHRVPDQGALMLVCTAVAGAGFVLFWAAPAIIPAAAGLLVCGLGVALLYPLTVSRLIEAWPSAPDGAAARAALGSGIAIGGAPFMLAQLSDSFGLRTAFLIVPVLLLLLTARGLSAARAVRAEPRS